jgi:hypothetical protein
LDDEDSWIVAEAKIFIHEHPDVPTSLISHDGRMIHLAKTHGVPIYDVPDCWRLEPESDEPARRIQDLEKRLQKYENQEPTIEFSIAFPTALVSDPPLIRKIVSRPLTPQQIDDLIEKARTYHPMTTNFAEPFGGSHLFVADPFSQWEPPSSSEIAKYQNVDYPAWIDGLKSTLTLLHLQFNRAVVPVEISLQNTGSRPARSLRVRFQLFGSAFFLPPDARQIAEIKELTLPPPPTPPSGRRTNPFFQHQELLASLASTLQFSGPSLSDQLLRISAQQRRQPGEFYWSPEKPKAESNIWSFECEDFRHQDRTETFSALIDLTQETNTTEFSLECSASAANLTELKKEYIPFRIEAHAQDFFDAVDEVFGRVGTWRPKADKD